MKVGIIGAGFTGLAAAYYLSKKGHSVEIFELDSRPGGLAIGYKEKGWKWTLESHYHHWFTNDKAVLELAKEIGHDVIIKRPKTSSYVDNKIFQLDSPLSLLRFSEISFIDRIRTGLAIALLRYNPFWKYLEKFRAEPYLKTFMGKSSYEKLWEPLMVNKLGEFSNKVSLAWFWARIYKRTPSLAYPKGGFLEFAYHIEDEIKKSGGKFYYDTEVKSLESKGKPILTFKSKDKTTIQKFDVILVTLPLSLFIKIAPTLSKKYVLEAKKLINIGAMNLILRLKDKFFPDNTYWLSMCDLNSPILAIVEHTNFMNKKNYNNEHLLYIGNYMETTDKRFGMNEQQLLKLYNPWLKKINPKYKKNIKDLKLFKAPFAQPIITPNYSKKIPKFKTPLKDIYLVNIQQVYPWDRGTNYAVELGKKAAKRIDEKN